MKRIFIGTSILFIFLPQIVFAYLDPGTGSYVIQVIIALFVGSAFAVKMFWKKILVFFKNLFKK